MNILQIQSNIYTLEMSNYEYDLFYIWDLILFTDHWYTLLLK